MKADATTDVLNIEVEMKADKADLAILVISEDDQQPIDATVLLKCTDPDTPDEFISTNGEEDEGQSGRYELLDALPWAGKGSCTLNVEKDGQVNYINILSLEFKVIVTPKLQETHESTCSGTRVSPAICGLIDLIGLIEPNYFSSRLLFWQRNPLTWWSSSWTTTKRLWTAQKLSFSVTIPPSRLCISCETMECTFLSALSPPSVPGNAR